VGPGDLALILSLGQPRQFSACWTELLGRFLNVDGTVFGEPNRRPSGHFDKSSGERQVHLSLLALRFCECGPKGVAHGCSPSRGVTWLNGRRVVFPVVSRCAVLQRLIAAEQDGNKNADRKPRDVPWRAPPAQSVAEAHKSPGPRKKGYLGLSLRGSASASRRAFRCFHSDNAAIADWTADAFGSRPSEMLSFGRREWCPRSSAKHTHHPVARRLVSA
jgi:hypothetical protein